MDGFNPWAGISILSEEEGRATDIHQMMAVF